MDIAPNVSLSLQDERGTPVTRMRRGALWVKTNVDGLTVHLITAHFKSKLLTFPGGRFSTTDENLRARVASRLALAERAQESVTLRRTVSDILKANADDALVLLGDLNDVPEAASSQILLGPEGSQPDDSPTGGRAFHASDQGDGARLFNLAQLIPLATRYSRINNGVPELIDQILISAQLVPFADAARKQRTRPIVTSHPEVRGGLSSVTGNPTARRNEPASDHAPVVARFEV